MKIIRRILGLILVILIIGIIVTYLMRNTLIEYFGEKIASQKYEAKIDIDKVDFDVLKGNIKVGRVQITDKNNTMRNIGDIKDINLDIEYKPLLKNLVVVEDLTLGLVEVLTPRKTDGALLTTKIVKKLDENNLKINKNSPTNSTKTTDINTNQSSNLDLNTLKDLEFKLSGDNYKENLEKLNLKIVKDYEVEREKIENIYDYWNEKIKGDEYKEKIDSLNERYKRLEKKIKTEKNPLNLIKELDELKEIVKEINNLVEDVKKEKSRFDKDLKTVKATKDKAFKYIKSDDYFKDIVGWDEKDLKIEINKIINSYAKAYIGKNIDIFNDFKKKADNSLNANQNSKPKYDFLIKQTNITFRHLNYRLVGDAQNITSKEGIISTPMTFKLNGDNQSIKANLNGRISQNKEDLKVKLDISGFEIDKKMVGENKKLLILVGSKVNLGYNMIYEKKVLNIFGDINLNNINLDIEKLDIDTKVKEILGDGLSNINALNLIYKYNGVTKKVEVTSNISDKISEIIRKVMKSNLERYKAQAREMANKEIKKYTDKLNLEAIKVEDLEELLKQDSIKLRELGIKTKSKQNSPLGIIPSSTESLQQNLKNLFK